MDQQELPSLPPVPVKGPVNFFKTLEVDKKKENEGVEIPIGDAVFLCKRAGGSNRRYRIALSVASENYREKLLSTDPDKQLEGEDMATLEAYADAVITGWRNVADRSGNPMEFNRANFIDLMTSCPDLWVELRMAARALSNFRSEMIERQGEALGNS